MTVPLEEAPTADLADGGHFVVLSADETTELRRVPVEDVANGIDLATTALQPADIDTAATFPAEYFATAAELGDIAAALAEILGE